ncbi:MAG: endonuclease NucS [Actinomycetota bacterium]|jgi:RecB family endonuclease NucS|nr:endonuclease NucS [Actinomycetota bacterium]
MRLLVARCSVIYTGRLETRLAEATRLIMVKADGCVAIHADGGAYKPLNWMNAPNEVVEFDDRWEVRNKKGELMTIHLHEVISDSAHELGEDPGLEKDGVEAHLQELLAEMPHVMEEGLTLVRREHFTALGPVDIICRDSAGRTVVIEVKRRGEIDGVEQLTRYLADLANDPTLGELRGMFVAQSIKPQARTLAESRGIMCVEVDYDELRGNKADDWTLFS